MIDVLDSYNCKVIKPLHKGLSSDKKYYIETAEEQQLFLRINDISEYERMKTMFELMKDAAVLGIPMTQPVEFGLCEDGKKCYQLLTWCNGEKAEVVLPRLKENEQYKLGLKSGDILQKIHSIQASNSLEDWSDRYLSVVGDRVEHFSNCGIQIQGSDAIFSYFRDNKHWLKDRPQCFHHGDYHNENLLITDNLKLSVIDWELLDYDNFADPWEEFNRINHSKLIPHFSTGQIKGYFNVEPPDEFWCLFALYISVGALMLVTWAFYRQKDELNYTIKNAHDVLSWFNNMNNVVPSWYLKDL